jgi:RNA polymerase sigma-70 factor (ECF subfamily)
LLEGYRPFLVGLLRARSLPAQDLDDLIQDVLLTLVRELPQFRHNGKPGAFRAWLRAIAANRLRSYWRSRGRDVPTDLMTLAEQFEDSASEQSKHWDELHRQHVLTRLLSLAERRFEPATFQAFRRVALEGVAPAQVAEELKMSVPAVYVAKSRVLRHLRQSSSGLID